MAHPDGTGSGDLTRAEDGHPEPLTVAPDATVAEVAERLVGHRRSSLLVVDEDGAPMGRILADDVLDALTARTRAAALPEVAAVTARDHAPTATGDGAADRTTAGPPAHGLNNPGRRSAAAAWRRVPGGRRFLAYLAIAGPGIIAANAGNDAAGIATYSSAGAQFIYRTLFFMVLVTVALVIVQEMAVRLGAFTGKGLAALIREQFSLRLTALALFCVLLANTGLVVSEFAGIGAAFELSASTVTGSSRPPRS